ncbi:hypothetical protein [Nostoc sp.]
MHHDEVELLQLRDRTFISAIAFTNYDHLTNYPTARASVRRSHD